MNALPKRTGVSWIATVSIGAILGSAFGCGGGKEVAPEAIAAAKRLWTNAGIRDYDLELNWSTSGMNTAHYVITVHAGTVQKVESIQPDGRRIVLVPGAAKYYSVDGLFLTIADELAQMQTDRPFNQPKGTKVVMRMETDPKLGYLHWYRRDVMGASQGARIDVIRLTPTAPAKAPLGASR
jgi:Family of unknown function (DUF6174)